MKVSWVLAIFKEFEAAWKQKWTTGMQDEEVATLTTNTWRRALSGLSGEDIRRGIEVTTAGLEWPPSVKEFLDAAKPPAPAMAAYHAANNVKPDHSLKKITSASGDKARKSAFAEMRSKLPGGA